MDHLTKTFQTDSLIAVLCIKEGKGYLNYIPKFQNVQNTDLEEYLDNQPTDEMTDVYNQAKYFCQMNNILLEMF